MELNTGIKTRSSTLGRLCFKRRRLDKVDFPSCLSGHTPILNLCSAQETGVSVIGNSADVFLSASFHPHRDTSGAVSGVVKRIGTSCHLRPWPAKKSVLSHHRNHDNLRNGVCLHRRRRQTSNLSCCRFIRRSWSSSHRHSSSDGTCRCIRP